MLPLRFLPTLGLLVVAASPSRALQDEPAPAEPDAPAEQVPTGEPEAEAVAEAPVDELLSAFPWRGLGPTTMGGRVTGLAVRPDRPSTFLVATATGGLWRTDDNGTTYTCVFEQEGSGSVGATALSPANPERLWVGTGEANPRNSVSWGDGVYRSDDGGGSWTHVGLEASRHIGAIAAHPTEPDVAFVAAMGSTWGPSPQRGLFRTTDGGASWQRVLFVDEQTGCIDVRIDPGNPQRVFAVTWTRQRDEFDSNDPARQTGPGSGLWLSGNGGDDWERLGDGLPTVEMGRIGLDIWQADSRVLVAVIETERTGERGAPPRSEERVSLGVTGRDAEGGGFTVESVREGESAFQAGLAEGDVIVRLGDVDVEGRAGLVAAMREYTPGDTAQLVFLREGVEEVGEFAFLGRITTRNTPSFAGSQGGQVANAHGRQGPEGFESGGIFRSDNGGESWTRVNSLNPRPFYYSQIRIDPRDDQRLWVLGIQLHTSADGGASFQTLTRGLHSDHHALWVDPRDGEHLLLGGDGGVYTSWSRGESWDHHDRLPLAQFYGIDVDDREPYWVYGGLQDNGSWGAPSRVGNGGPRATDWVRVGSGDGFGIEVDDAQPHLVYSTSQNGALSRLDMRTGARTRVRPPRGARFNWNTPFLLSPHNSGTLLFAGERVFRSIDGGTTVRALSESLSRTERGSATALAQSPFDERVVAVGFDDGALAWTRDGGATWEDLAAKLPGERPPLYVSDIVFCPFRTDTLYVTLDGHRSDDYAPYVFVSHDGGETFESRVDGLPADGSVRCLLPDPERRDLVYLGTEFGCYASLDGGARWRPLGAGLPTVPVHDLELQARAGELVAGTHGRGIWIVPVRGLQGLDPRELEREPQLLPIQPLRLALNAPSNETSGMARWTADGAPRVVQLYYHLPVDEGESIRLSITDASGNPVGTVSGPGGAGLQRVDWTPGARAGRGRFGPGGRGGFAGRGRATLEPGDYTVQLGADGPTRRLRVLAAGQ